MVYAITSVERLYVLGRFLCRVVSEMLWKDWVKEIDTREGRRKGSSKRELCPHLTLYLSLITSSGHSFIYPFMYLVVQYMPSGARNCYSDSHSSVAACPEHA